MLGVMARKLRLQYEGAIYHVMNRGDHQEAIFRGVGWPELFLSYLGSRFDRLLHRFAQPKHVALLQ